jgi:hypothetical protein
LIRLVHLFAMPPIQHAEQAGFDMSLVDASLRLTPEERLLQHQAALAWVSAAEQAGRELRERTQRPVAAP